MADAGQRVGIPGVEEPRVKKEAKVSFCFSVKFAQRLQDVLVRDWDVSDLCSGAYTRYQGIQVSQVVAA